MKKTAARHTGTHTRTFKPFRKSAMALLFVTPVVMVAFQNCAQTQPIDFTGPESAQKATGNSSGDLSTASATTDGDTPRAPASELPAQDVPPATMPPATMPPATMPPATSSTDDAQNDPNPTQVDPTPIFTPQITLAQSVAGPVLEGGKASFSLTGKDLSLAEVKCTSLTISPASSIPKVVFSKTFNATTNGTLATTFDFVMKEDVSCEARGLPSDQSEVVTAPAIEVAVNCANRIKTGGACQDFSCQKFQALSIEQIANVPARDSVGTCYTVKLMDKIANSGSKLTTAIDYDVISRNHFYDTPNRYPFVLGTKKLEFKLSGERVVKVAGGSSSSARILVDNFLVSGVFPSDTPENQVSSFYRARGTSDSATFDQNGASTGTIQFHGLPLKLEPFGTGGTSSIAPLDLSATVEPNRLFTLDLRALDCGGARELSDIYLLFQ